MQTNILIPGFATRRPFYEPLIRGMEKKAPVRFLELNEFTYAEAERMIDKAVINEAAVNLIGWSLGSLFAMKWALKNQGKINSMILTGATARFCAKEGYENGIGEDKLRQMTAMIAKKPEIVLRGFFGTALEKVKDNSPLIEQCIKEMPVIDALRNGLNELKTIDLLDDLPDLKTRTMIIHGADDKITPLAGARIMKERIPGCQLEVCEGGHCLFLENPHDFIERSTRYL